MVEIRKLPPNRWRDYKRLRLEALKLSPLAFGERARARALHDEGAEYAGRWENYIPPELRGESRRKTGDQGTA